jgi:hypothetical protein
MKERQSRSCLDCACVRERALLQAYVWHLCMCACVRAGDRRHVGLEVSATRGAHDSPRDSPPSISHHSPCTADRDREKGPAELGRTAMIPLSLAKLRSCSRRRQQRPPQIPGGAATCTCATPRPPAVQSPPVKSASSMASVPAHACHRSARHGRACARLPACLYLRAAAPVSAPMRARTPCALQSSEYVPYAVKCAHVGTTRGCHAVVLRARPCACRALPPPSVVLVLLGRTPPSSCPQALSCRPDMLSTVASS